MIDTTLTFDGQTENTSVSLPSGWSTIGQVPVTASAAALHGDRGARYASTTTSGRMQYDYGSNQTARPVYVQTYFRIGTLPSVNLYINAVLSLATGGSLQGDFRVNTNGTVSIRNGSTAVATSTQALAAGTWYRSDWMLDDAGDTQELRIYAGDTSSAILTISGTWSSSLTRVVSVGPNVAAADGVNFDIDTVRLSDQRQNAYNPTAPVTAWSRKLANGTWAPVYPQFGA